MNRILDTSKFLYFYSIPPSIAIGAIIELEKKKPDISYMSAITTGMVKGATATVFFPLTIYKFLYPHKNK